MTNPLVHALVFVAAVILPGGLLVYFGWRAACAHKAKAREKKKYRRPTPEEAREAFLSMYPVDSLRARNRCNRLNAYKTRPRKKFPE